MVADTRTRSDLFAGLFFHRLGRTVAEHVYCGRDKEHCCLSRRYPVVLYHKEPALLDFILLARRNFVFFRLHFHGCRHCGYLAEREIGHRTSNSWRARVSGHGWRVVAQAHSISRVYYLLPGLIFLYIRISAQRVFAERRTGKRRYFVFRLQTRYCTHLGCIISRNSA